VQSSGNHSSTSSSEITVHAVHKKQMKKNTKQKGQKEKPADVEAVTSQNYVLHMVNPVTTVERAITMQDVSNQLLNRKFM